jgi:hypothetical protein
LTGGQEVAGSNPVSPIFDAAAKIRELSGESGKSTESSIHRSARSTFHSLFSFVLWQMWRALAVNGAVEESGAMVMELRHGHVLLNHTQPSRRQDLRGTRHPESLRRRTSQGLFRAHQIIRWACSQVTRPDSVTSVCQAHWQLQAAASAGRPNKRSWFKSQPDYCRLTSEIAPYADFIEFKHPVTLP